MSMLTDDVDDVDEFVDDDVDSLRARVRSMSRELSRLRAAQIDSNDAPLFSAQTSAHSFAVSKLNVEQFFKAQPMVRDVRGPMPPTDATWHMHFYDFFCIDHWPLVELLQSTPSDVDGLRVPRYERFLNVPLPLPDDMTDERLLAANKRGGAPESSRSACFNCGQPTHAFSACPEPRNWSRIAANRNAARAHRGLSGEQAADERYYAGASRQEAMMTQFSAGVLSPELRAALRIGANEIPEFARRMRALGGLGPTYQTLVGTQDEIRIPGVNVDLPPEATQRYNPFDVDDGPPPPPPPPTTHARPANYWSGYS